MGGRLKVTHRKEEKMTVEIVSTLIHGKDVIISAVDISSERLQWLERRRMDEENPEIEFRFDTTDKKQFAVLRRWMLQQKCTADKKTWGEAIASLQGTVTDTYGIGKFRVWDM